MTLINCPECSHQVVSDAPACPECGFPLEEALPREESAKTTAHRLGRVTRSVLTECKEIALATIERSRQLIHRVRMGHRVRRQRRDLEICRRQFGEWLFQHDLGDEACRDAIRQLNVQIDATRQTRGSVRQMQEERKQMIIRLSATHIPAAGEPGFQRYELVQQAEQSLESCENELRSAKRATGSPDGITRRRVGIGYSVLGVAFTLLILAVLACIEGSPKKSDDANALASPGGIADLGREHARAPEPLLRDIASFTCNIPVLIVETIEGPAPQAKRPYGPQLPPEQTIGSVVEYRGRLDAIEMEFVRRPNSTPFRLAITEENPGSSGPSLESSIWLAATVAALQRSDALSGVEVTFSISGDVDGASAGGVVCLALLSALDNKRLPDDFAFTGSVLPDGTIGRVGGVVEKINAAKNKGATRVLVPTGIRFEEDMNSGKLTDLKQLARSLNLQFLTVRNIEQAYHAVHGTPAPAPLNVPTDFAELPELLERLLIDDCRKRLDQGDAIWRSLSEDEQQKLISDPFVADWFVSRFQAEQSYRAGQLCYARDKATEWALLMQAREANKRFFSSPTNAADPKRLFSSLDAQIQKTLADAPQPRDVVQELSCVLPPIASQFCVDADTFHSYKHIVAQIDAGLAGDLQVIKETANSHLPAGTTREQLAFQAAFERKAVELLFANTAMRYQQGYAEDAKQLSKDLSLVPQDFDRARQVEQFFHTAYRSIYQSLKTEVVNPIAKGSDISEAQARQLIAETDQGFMSHVPLHVEALKSHQQLRQSRNTMSEREFLTALYAQVFATYIADVSSITVRWTELDADLDDDGMVAYGRLELLSYMLREARENAVERIVECKRHGIPCPAAIWFFQTGEATRDDNTVDKVDVLASYWRASLQAQALQMLFQEEP